MMRVSGEHFPDAKSSLEQGWSSSYRLVVGGGGWDTSDHRGQSRRRPSQNDWEDCW